MDHEDEPPALADLSVYLLSRVARLAKKELDDRLSARGYRLRHMAVLAAAARDGSASQLALGRHVRLDPSDVTATLDDLERRGLVRRAVDPADRRRRLVSTTRAGRRELRLLQQIAEQVGDDLLEPLDPARRDQLHAALRDVLRARSARAEATSSPR